MRLYRWVSRHYAEAVACFAFAIVAVFLAVGPIMLARG